MRESIPQLVLILVGIGFYYSTTSEKTINYKPDKIGVIENSEDAQTDDNPLAKEKLDSKGSEDNPLVKKDLENKESEDKEIYGDPLPPRYLSNWLTDDGLMKLMQGPDMWVRGFYYFEDQELKGRVPTRYIQKDNRKILSGYWVQNESPRRCVYSRYGSEYRGRLTFNFKGDSFTGQWGFCDDKPQSQWNGKLI